MLYFVINVYTIYTGAELLPAEDQMSNSDSDEYGENESSDDDDDDEEVKLFNLKYIIR